MSPTMRTSPWVGACSPVNEARAWVKRALRVKRSCSQVSPAGRDEPVKLTMRWIIFEWKGSKLE